MPLENLYRRITALQEFDVIVETMNIVRKNGDLLSDLLKIQLSQGKDSQGNNVTIFGKDYYSDRTVQNKRYNSPTELGKQSEWITNYFTGEFYQLIKISIEGTFFTFDSEVPYFDEILRRSGRVIMDLNKEHLQLFIEEILRPQLQARFKQLENGV